jgi:putative inorganic carbon (hco3(-)) transporter
MAIRATWRPPWFAWIALWALALAGVHQAKPDLLHDSSLLLTPLALAVGVALLHWLWRQPPAVPMCGAIALSVFSGAWGQIGLGGAPLDRVLLVVVLAQFLLRAPGVAHVPRPQLRNVHLLMALVLLYAVISALAAQTLANRSSSLLLLDQVGAVPYLMYLFAPAVFSGVLERRLLLGTLVVLGAYLGATAIFESLGPHALVFPRYIAQVDRELPGERAGGPFQSSVTEGFATFACAVAAAIAFRQWRSARARAFAAFSAGVCLCGCFLTLERSVWIAAVAAAIATALLSAGTRRWLVPGALLCALAVAGALTFVPSLADKTSARASDQRSVWDRKNQTAAGLRMVAAKPLLGFGWGRYTREGLDYFRQADDYPLSGFAPNAIGSSERPLPLHDTYLAYAVELGLVGLLLWLLTQLWGVGAAIFGRGSPALRPWKLGLVAVAIFFFVVAAFNPYQQDFPVLLLWIWAGVATGSLSLAQQLERQRLRLPRGESRSQLPVEGELERLLHRGARPIGV